MTPIRYKLSTMGCGSTFAQLPLSQFVKMIKDCDVLGELVSVCASLLAYLTCVACFICFSTFVVVACFDAEVQKKSCTKCINIFFLFYSLGGGVFVFQVPSADVTQAFLEARIIRPKELATSDRCLSFVDFLEALLRLATKMQGFWPLPDKKKKLADDRDELAAGKRGSKMNTAERLEEERVQLEAEREAERNGLWGDEAFSACHRTVMHLLESLLMALRDQDPAGLRFYSESCKQREQRLAEDVLERQKEAAALASTLEGSKQRPSSSGGLDSSEGGVSRSRESKQVDHENSFFHSEEDPLEDLVFNLEALEALAEQAIHVHRARTKGANTVFSLNSLVSSDSVLEEMMS